MEIFMKLIPASYETLTVDCADQIATITLGRIKHMVQQSFHASLEGQIELETQQIAASAKTSDGLAGVHVLVNKKKLTFTSK
jgi:hypothetical protein